ncbi:hypothetical protein ACVU7I_02315 [Patulibacter sp. S7RM1-6]
MADDDRTDPEPEDLTGEPVERVREAERALDPDREKDDDRGGVPELTPDSVVPALRRHDRQSGGGDPRTP